MKEIVLLPRKMIFCDPAVKPKKVLESMGVVFLSAGQKEEQGKILRFYNAKLPVGWVVNDLLEDCKINNECSVWASKLRDNKGRERAYIRKYHGPKKISFYLCLVRRFDGHEDGMKTIITDCGQTIHATDKFEEAKKWLEKKYPDWKSPTAYWD